MSTPTIPNTLPIDSHDDDTDDDTDDDSYDDSYDDTDDDSYDPVIDPIAKDIASFLSNDFSPDQPILTLCPISVRLNYLVDYWFCPIIEAPPMHPLLSFLDPFQRAAMRYKYTRSTQTLIIQHPGMPNGIRQVFPDFLLYHMRSALLSSGVLTPWEFGRICARCASAFELEKIGRKIIGLKQAELELRFNKDRWTRTEPHIVFEVRMGQKYEPVKADVQEWLVTTQREDKSEGVRLGVLVYYEEGKVPDGGKEWGESSYEPKNRDGCVPLPQTFPPPLTYFFETYRYDDNTKDIKLAQERTYLFRDGERMTPEPIFELSRWDFGLDWGDEDEEHPIDWQSRGGGPDDSVCRIPLGGLQDWIEYDRSQDRLTEEGNNRR